MRICRKNNLAFTERINRCIRSCFHKQNGRTIQGTISPFNPHLHFRTSHYKNTHFIPPIVNGGSQNLQKNLPWHCWAMHSVYKPNGMNNKSMQCMWMRTATISESKVFGDKILLHCSAVNKRITVDSKYGQERYWCYTHVYHYLKHFFQNWCLFLKHGCG